MADPIYVLDPLEVDADILQQEAFEFIQVQWPDWTPDDSNLEAWLIAACARMVAEARDVAADVPPAIFRYYGQKVLGVPPIDATSATVDSTWTFVDNPSGRTILAGTLVAIKKADDTPVAFEVVSDVTVASPTLTTASGGVSLRSIETGADTSGLGGAGTEIDQLDPVAWVDTITITAETDGGQDEETDDAYLTRLSRRLTLLTPRPIIDNDFKLLAEDIAEQNGVNSRILVLDNYDPGTGDPYAERKVHLVVMDSVTGANLTTPIKTAISTELEAQREQSFIVTVGDPTRHVIDVNFNGIALPGYDPQIVEDDAVAAIRSFLQPYNWGAPSSSETGLSGSWIQRDTLRRQELATVLNNVEGFDYYTVLNYSTDGGAVSTGDLTLSGVAPITTPGDIVGSVTTP